MSNHGRSTVPRRVFDIRCRYLSFVQEMSTLFHKFKLSDVILQLNRNAEFLWRYAKATYYKSRMEQLYENADKDKVKQLVYKAKDLAQKALQLNERSSNAHKW